MIDFRTGDLLLIHVTAGGANAAAYADGLYPHLHRLGVHLQLVFDDIPAAAEGNANETVWLGAMLECASRVVCTSEEVARSLKTWCAAQRPDLCLPPVEVAAPARFG